MTILPLKEIVDLPLYPGGPNALYDPDYRTGQGEGRLPRLWDFNCALTGREYDRTAPTPTDLVHHMAIHTASWFPEIGSDADPYMDPTFREAWAESARRTKTEGVSFMTPRAEPVVESLIFRYWLWLEGALGIEANRLGNLLETGKLYQSVLTPLLKHWYTHGARTVPRNPHPHPLLPMTIRDVVQPPHTALWDSGDFPPMLPVWGPVAHPMQVHLPFADQDWDEVQAPPLALYEGTALPFDPRYPHMRREVGGHAAPVALRLWLEAVLAVSQDHWSEYSRVEIPRAHLVRWLWPGRPARYHEYMPRLLEASRVLDALWLPYTNSVGHPYIRRMVQFEEIPTGKGRVAGQQPVGIRISLPPDGGREGAPVNREALRILGLQARGAHRAYINLAYRWHQPGRTRIPNKHGGWFWSRKENRYPLVSTAELRALCFPAGRDTNMSRQRQRSEVALGYLEKVGVLTWRMEDRKHYRLLPGPQHTRTDLWGTGSPDFEGGH